MSNFYKYFKENMDSLGLEAPESLFGSPDIALAKAAQIGGAIAKLGRSATLLEIIGATTGLEKLMVVSGLSACYYVGGVIGSIAVATGRTLSGGTSIADCLAVADRINLRSSWLQDQLSRHPGVYNGKGHPSYRANAFVAGKYFTAKKSVA